MTINSLLRSAASVAFLALSAADAHAQPSAMLQDAAQSAWTFADRNYVSETGLTRPFDTYGVVTIWDLASGLAALHCAYLLGLVDANTHEARLRRALQTLATMPLFEGKYFNKEYNTLNASMLGIERRPSRRGFGTSATDVGRLLTWLRIIRDSNPAFVADVNRVIARVSLDDYVDDGYLVGRQISSRTGRVREFQEGRIGYEQYAARGFALWNKSAEHALDAGKNMDEITIEGIRLPRDKRGADRLTSEPFVLSGLETGWTTQMRDYALAVLEAQRLRFVRTGVLTAVSEDAIDLAPHYFFYFTVLSRHGPWSLDVQRPGAKVTQPKWVSTKAALGWYALVPSPYTQRVAQYVWRGARLRGVFGSGIFENGRPTANPNINTAAVILEAAVYQKFGRPIQRVHSPFVMGR